MQNPVPIEATDRKSEYLLRLLAATTFLIFFQAYMIAPLIPRLSSVFGASVKTVGVAIPAYMIPYAISVLFFGLASDRIGRRRIMLTSLLAFVVLTALTATSRSAQQLVFWRLLTGFGASGVVPLTLALISTLYPYEQRGRPLGWIFGAMAGGMAFGSTFGVIAEPFIGWRGLFLSVGAVGLVLLAMLRKYASLLGEAPATRTVSLAKILGGYRSLLRAKRGSTTYIYVLLNAIFHSGVFTWLGLYFAKRYRLGEIGIGLALLGYGVPGFLLGPLIGRAADRWGRRWLIPMGLAIGAVSAAILIPDQPLISAAIAITALSLGYDMTQPLFAGIVTSLDQQRSGQAMGLNVFCLFMGFGLGSLVFGQMMNLGFNSALGWFSTGELVLAMLALSLFGAEIHSQVGRPAQPR